jgi:hypothetical protein
MANHIVTEYYEAFTSIITGSPCDETKQFPFDIDELFFTAGANANLICMIHSDTVTLSVAPPNKRVSAALRCLNTIKDLLITTEGKVQVIKGQIQAMTGNQRLHTNMAMPPMVNMAYPFLPSQHHQPPYYFNLGASTSSELATSNPAVFQFHPGMMRDQHPPAYQPEHSWPHLHQTPDNHTSNQHGSMDSAAIFHSTVSYNPESRTEQEVMLDAAIFLNVAESAIRHPPSNQGMRAAEMLGMSWYKGHT